MTSFIKEAEQPQPRNQISFAGYNPMDNFGAVKPPIHPASTFVFQAKAGAAHKETAYGIEGAEAPPEDGFIYID